MLSDSDYAGLLDIELLEEIDIKVFENSMLKYAREAGYSVESRMDTIRVGGVLLGSKYPCVLVVNEEHKKDYYHLCLFQRGKRLYAGFTGRSRYQSAERTKDLLLRPSTIDFGGEKRRWLGDEGVSSYNRAMRNTELAVGATMEAVAMAKDVIHGGFKNLGGRKEKQEAESDYYNTLIGLVLELCGLTGEEEGVWVKE